MPAAPVSKLHTAMFDALEAAQKEVAPNAITLPTMTTGATDSSFLRAKGVQAYGISVPTAAHPPLYPTVLAGLSLLGGDGVLAQRALGAFLGGVTIVLVALIGRRVGGDRVGLVAAAVAALHPVLVGADGAPMSESLYGLLVAACLLVALRLRERRGVGLAAALGALIGLAALTRSEALLLVILIGLPLTLSGARAGRWRRALALCGACAVVLAPWTIRNWSAFDRPTLISHNDSTVLAGANCPAPLPSHCCSSAPQVPSSVAWPTAGARVVSSRCVS